MTKALAYLRTSSAANVGSDKDSDKRQRAAIDAYAKANGVEIVGEYYDAAVSGADPVESRPGFAAMLQHIAGNGVRRIVVENATRFARDLMVQEIGFAMLHRLGIELIAADSPTSFVDNTPTAQLIRQILGAVSQFEKAMIVAKLKGARDRASAAKGRRVDGRKAYRDLNPAMVEAARLARSEAGSGVSLAAIAARLNEKGLRNEAGNAFAPMTVKRLLDQATAA